MTQPPPDDQGRPGEYRPYTPPGGAPQPEPGPARSYPPQTTYGQQPTYGQPPYGQPASAYGQTPYGYGPPPYGYGSAPDHQQSTTVLVLGILGLVACQLVSPFAWAMGSRVVREIDQSQGRLGGRSAANAGRICGIVGSVILIVSVTVFTLLVLSALAGA